MLDRITFGITSFERPRLLERLVASIRRKYPRSRIVVADNGRRKASLPGDVTVLNLKFDCGLSHARNQLIDHLETEFLLLLEEDFLFTDETRVEPFVEVLDTDHEIGFVGGSIRGRNGRRSSYALDIDVFRDVMYVQDSSRRMRLTPYGTSYRVCDIVWNFGLIRREFLQEHRWDDRLKVGEHAAYFHQVKLAGRWRVASCPEVTVYHVPDIRADSYLKHRHRGQQYFHEYMARNGLKDYRRVPPVMYDGDLHGRPNVVVLGVGHSGTSILTRMMAAAGWEAAEADREFAECTWVRDANIRLIRTGEFDAAECFRRLQAMPQPWVIKDPRFVFTLNYWLQLFAEMEQPPALVRIVRDADDVKRSYLRRGFRGNIHDLVAQRVRLCQEQYNRWPWSRLLVDYSQLAEAVSLFTPRTAPDGDLPPVWPPGPLNATSLPVPHPLPAAKSGLVPPLQDPSIQMENDPRPLPELWPGGFPRDQDADRHETDRIQSDQAAAPQGHAGQSNFAPGWRATVQHDEDIERHDTDRLDMDGMRREFVPGWRATVQHDEDIERHDTDRLDMDGLRREFVPGWRATVQHDEDIERHDTDRLDMDGAV